MVITPFSEDYSDILAASLADAGFESFVTDDDGLTAYVKKELYDPDSVDAVIASWPYPCRLQLCQALAIEGRDWNHEWEKNYFKPIVIGDECVVHSSFHTGYQQCRYDIAIDPKMAFGTGHHATTSLIIEYLLGEPLEGKSVIDMGTGTGILAILAYKRGASPVCGIEIDEGAWRNAVENVQMNGASGIHLIHGDARALTQFAMLDGDTDRHADLLIANINRNIILADMGEYAAALKSGGVMILSGFYEEDSHLLAEAGAIHGLRVTDRKVHDRWCAMRLCKD